MKFKNIEKHLKEYCTAGHWIGSDDLDLWFMEKPGGEHKKVVKVDNPKNDYYYYVIRYPKEDL